MMQLMCDVTNMLGGVWSPILGTLKRCSMHKANEPISWMCCFKYAQPVDHIRAITLEIRWEASLLTGACSGWDATSVQAVLSWRVEMCRDVVLWSWLWCMWVHQRHSDRG